MSGRSPPIQLSWTLFPVSLSITADKKPDIVCNAQLEKLHSKDNENNSFDLLSRLGSDAIFKLINLYTTKIFFCLTFFVSNSTDLDIYKL